MQPIVAPVQTDGTGAGGADVSGYSGARLLAVAVDYAAGAAAGTTVTITNPGLPGNPVSIAIPASNTDKTFYPRVPVQTPAGADIAGHGEEPPIVYGRVHIAVAGAGGALNPAVTVRLLFDN